MFLLSTKLQCVRNMIPAGLLKASLMTVMLRLIVSVLLSSEVAMAQQCLQPANPQGVIPFGDVSGGDRAGTDELRERQMIVTSYQFQCCGNITRWQTYVCPNGDNHDDGQYNIRFQVWRPSTPGVDDGCYDLAGEDNNENILFPTTRGLVNRTVAQPSQLTVLPGDVVGFFVRALDDDGELIDGSIQFNENAEMGFTEEQAWYNEDFLMIYRDVCPFPVGPGQALSGSIRAAPVLSLDIDQMPCEASTFQLTHHTTPFQTTVRVTTFAGVVGNTVYVTVGVLRTIVLLLLGITAVLGTVLCLKRIRNKNKEVKVLTAAATPTSTDINAKPADNISLEVNECYSPSTQMKANECYSTTAAADIPLKVNECYNTNMPMKANECYATTTAVDIPLEVKECYSATTR